MEADEIRVKGIFAPSGRAWDLSFTFYDVVANDGSRHRYTILYELVGPHKGPVLRRFPFSDSLRLELLQGFVETSSGKKFTFDHATADVLLVWLDSVLLGL